MATPYAITVQPKQGPNGIEWVLCDVNANKCGGPGTNPRTAYPQILLPAQTGQYDFTVTIKEPAFGITFAPVATSPTSADAALWVTLGQGQHPGQGNNSSGQITNAALSGPASTTLTFTDKNSNPNAMWLSYALNFVGPNGQAVTSIDPDIKNGGTQIGTELTTNTAILLGGALLLLLILAWFGFRSYRQRSVRE